MYMWMFVYYKLLNYLFKNAMETNTLHCNSDMWATVYGRTAVMVSRLQIHFNQSKHGILGVRIEFVVQTPFRLRPDCEYKLPELHKFI